MELARIRLRGVYAMVAGVLLAFAVPYFQGAFLDSQGYADAVRPLVTGENFAPLLAWIAAHSADDRGLRLLELIPYIGLFLLPPSLVRVLWDPAERNATIARLAGQGGFALYLIAGAAGIITSTTTSAAYVGARSAAARSAAVSTFAAGYAIETVLARVLGGLLIALFLLLVSARIVRVKPVPAWLGYVGVLIGALQGATALLFALAPTQPETATSAVAYFSLALWLFLTGYFLFQMVEVNEEQPITKSATQP